MDTRTEEPVWVAWEGHGKFLGSRHRMRKLLMYVLFFVFIFSAKLMNCLFSTQKQASRLKSQTWEIMRRASKTPLFLKLELILAKF